MRCLRISCAGSIPACLTQTPSNDGGFLIFEVRYPCVTHEFFAILPDFVVLLELYGYILA